METEMQIARKALLLVPLVAALAVAPSPAKAAGDIQAYGSCLTEALKIFGTHDEVISYISGQIHRRTQRQTK
jgi:hypothetical protein